jgi:hypothetical protein
MSDVFGTPASLSAPLASPQLRQVMPITRDAPGFSSISKIMAFTSNINGVRRAANIGHYRVTDPENANKVILPNIKRISNKAWE